MNVIVPARKADPSPMLAVGEATLATANAAAAPAEIALVVTGTSAPMRGALALLSRRAEASPVAPHWNDPKRLLRAEPSRLVFHYLERVCYAQLEQSWSKPRR